jgi:hypothetical protein
MDRKWTIAIRPMDQQRPRKITKVIGLNGEGFSVLVPYHRARSGYLLKMPIDPAQALTPGEWSVPREACVAFTAEDRVKLSYHSDGFAQFSSEVSGRIISGRDSITGEPKGLGLFARPLDNPIWSGPSVGINLWGIDAFDEVSEAERTVLFEPNDCYHRGCTPDEANAWYVAIYAFPKNVIPPVRYYQGRALLDVAFEGVNGPLTSVVQMRVLQLPEEKVFLGLYVNRLRVGFPQRSGWMLGGPGDWTKDRKGHVLKAIYPRDMIPVDGSSSLSRRPATED